MIRAEDCAALTITDLTVHGAYLTMAEGGQEQMHGIFLAPGCDGVTLEDVEVFQSAGDGVRLIGDSAEPTHRPTHDVRVDRCHLIQNHRSGVAIQREVHSVRIRSCVIEMTAPGDDACIDLEPTGNPEAAAPRDVLIESTTLVHGNPAMAVSLSGISPSQPSRRVRFIRNTLTGGRVGAVHTERLTLLANTIDAGPAELAGAMIRLRGTCVGLRVEGNDVRAAGTQADGISVGGEVERMTVVDNDVRTAGVGIDVTASGDTVDVRGNRIRGENLSPGIRVRTKGVPDVPTTHQDIRVVDNVVLDFDRAGIIVGPDKVPDKLHNPVITGNTIDREGQVPPGLVGIHLVGRVGQWVDAVVEDNTIGATINIPIQGPM